MTKLILTNNVCLKYQLLIMAQLFKIVEQNHTTQEFKHLSLPTILMLETQTQDIQEVMLVDSIVIENCIPCLNSKPENISSLPNKI